MSVEHLSSGFPQNSRFAGSICAASHQSSLRKGCLLRGHGGRYIEGTIRSGWGSTLIRNYGVGGEMRGAEGVGVEQGAPGLSRWGEGVPRV